MKTLRKAGPRAGPISCLMIASAALVVILLTVVAPRGSGHEVSLTVESVPQASELRVGAPVGTSYHLSQAEGERQLDRLARTVETEDAWLFLQADSLWIDAG